eukprot:scaffold2229_cov413-Prasinococcus_capsulatus_cf.AAC.8
MRPRQRGRANRKTRATKTQRRRHTTSWRGSAGRRLCQGAPPAAHPGHRQGSAGGNCAECYSACSLLSPRLRTLCQPLQLWACPGPVLGHLRTVPGAHAPLSRVGLRDMKRVQPCQARPRSRGAAGFGGPVGVSLRRAAMACGSECVRPSQEKGRVCVGSRLPGHAGPSAIHDEADQCVLLQVALCPNLEPGRPTRVRPVRTAASLLRGVVRASTSSTRSQPPPCTLPTDGMPARMRPGVDGPHR